MMLLGLMSWGARGESIKFTDGINALFLSRRRSNPDIIYISIPTSSKSSLHQVNVHITTNIIKMQTVDSGDQGTNRAKLP